MRMLWTKQQKKNDPRQWITDDHAAGPVTDEIITGPEPLAVEEIISLLVQPDEQALTDVADPADVADQAEAADLTNVADLTEATDLAGIIEATPRQRSRAFPTSPAITALLATVREALQQGQSVSLSGLGSFSVQSRPARTGRNPRTGESISIPASKRIHFKNAGVLRQILGDGA